MARQLLNAFDFESNLCSNFHLPCRSKLKCYKFTKQITTWCHTCHIAERFGDEANTTLQKLQWFQIQKSHPIALEVGRVAAVNMQSLNKQFLSWSSGNASVSEAGGLRLKSRAGQIGHRVANGSPLGRHFFEGSHIALRRNDAEIGPAT